MLGEQGADTPPDLPGDRDTVCRNPEDEVQEVAAAWELCYSEKAWERIKPPFWDSVESC